MPQNHYLIEICTLVNLNADLKSQILNCYDSIPQALDYFLYSNL